MDALLIEDVCKSYRTTRAVNSLSMTVSAGSICGFLGPNGAGKTTTIRMIMDIIRPDSGRIVLFDRFAPAEGKKRVGYMPEERGLYPKMTVRKVLTYLADIKGVPRRVSRTVIVDWLERLDLARCADKKVEELSRGMQQKLQYIAAIIHDPDLIVLDEPFSGLDPISTDVLKAIILQMKAAGKTVIFSTHVMEQAEQLCDFILLIDQGRNVLSGTLAAIRAQYRTEGVLVSVEGDSGFVKDLPMVSGVSAAADGLSVTLRDGADKRALLRAILERVSVSHFEVKVPSLHEIFVRTVGESRE